MNTISVSIDTTDKSLSWDLFGNPTQLGPGAKVAIPGDAELTLQSMMVRKAFGVPETLNLLLGFGVGVGSSLVANWIYAKLKDRPETTLRLEEQEVQLEEGEIKRVITRLIEMKSK